MASSTSFSARMLAAQPRRAAPVTVAGGRFRAARLPALSARPRVAVRGTPKPDVEQAVKEAEETCKSGTDAECSAAWDVAEEVSSAAANQREKESAEKGDPLDQFCEETPEADECRVYEE